MFTLINTSRFTLGLKRFVGWCWFLHVNEGRVRVVQVGPVIVEIISSVEGE